jgi:pyridinium-3,5-bisthiocarboxylic acid mononucleotide nickel chelatase
MRIAYLDCFAGISGDMLLGALIDAGVPSQVLLDAAAALELGATISINKVDRSGISSTKVDVLDHGKPADARTNLSDSGHSHKHEHHPGENHKAEQSHSRSDPHDHHHDHSHSHDLPHTHGRSLSVIRSMIQAANLPEPAKQMAVQAFQLLGMSEAKIHNANIEKIHFHEVGAVDAIVDIVAASAGIHALGVDAWYVSPLNVGGGMVDCAHGRFPVPAPATADLLRDVPTYSAYVQQELVTPTGAALIRTLAPTFGPQPAMRVQQIGYGAGSRDPKGFPNVLRLSIGEAAGTQHSSVAILETAIDDLSPQILAHVTERALSLGALDVMTTAVNMKKGRLGTLVTILTEDANIPGLEDLLLRETSTLGVRIHHERRSCLDRSHTIVNTPYGDVRIKLGIRSGEILNAAPEFEDCRAAAAQHGIPVKQVQQAAIAAYHSGRIRSE